MSRLAIALIVSLLTDAHLAPAAEKSKAKEAR